MSFSIKQEVFPEIDLDLVNVTVAYPGAGPEEVEDGIILKIEENLSSLTGIKEIKSFAAEGIGTVTAEVLTGEDTDLVLQDIKSEIDRIVTFPEEAERPVVTKVVNRREVISIVVYGKAPERSLREQAEFIRDELLAMPNITQVDLRGVRPYEISIEISEEDMLEAIKFGHIYIKELIDFQNEFIKELKPEKMEVLEPEVPDGLYEKIDDIALPKIRSAIEITEKQRRHEELSSIKSELLEELGEEYEQHPALIKERIEELEKREVRTKILTKEKRLDGRGLEDVRQITCEVGVLPRAHGSSLFTRGQTQSLGAVTLGTKIDEQFVETLEGETTKSYMLHYNFPPFSVGEVRPFRGPGRREIGHGNLAERSLKYIIPDDDSFPYTIRIVSDILESNGSSSMASVCSGSLGLMDAGVPIKCHVAGIAMGLIKQDDEVKILTDILGDEDHLGDMDFKVAGSRDGITAVQMDIKISGITYEIMSNALAQAKGARHKILEIMEEAISRPRSEISKYAPRILTVLVPPEKIGLVIGPGGKTIRGIIEETGVKIDIDDTGLTVISSQDVDAALKAKSIVEALIEEPAVGKQYSATVKKITNYGAFAEFLPGKEGLIHISELGTKRVASVSEVVNVGDKIDVILKKVDREGRYDLSHKEYLKNNQSQKD